MSDTPQRESHRRPHASPMTGAFMEFDLRQKCIGCTMRRPGALVRTPEPSSSTKTSVLS